MHEYANCCTPFTSGREMLFSIVFENDFFTDLTNFITVLQENHLLGWQPLSKEVPSYWNVKSHKL